MNFWDFVAEKDFVFAVLTAGCYMAAVHYSLTIMNPMLTSIYELDP